MAIHRRGAGDIWQGLWEPYLENEEFKPDLKGWFTILKREVKHVLTHQVILADFALLQTDEPPQLPPDYIWVEENDLDNYGVPRLVERLFRAVRLYDEEPD